uniref:Uncharacterized protein n=1 Tax=Rhizophora mucronata TaxID=61149 RepID=A0A2P2KLI3_RHIMU
MCFSWKFFFSFRTISGKSSISSNWTYRSANLVLQCGFKVWPCLNVLLITFSYAFPSQWNFLFSDGEFCEYCRLILPP